MSGTAPKTLEWYLARDGAQHGPISDVEMRKFVELGHLRPTDLVWCAQFTAWQSGAAAFPDAFRGGPPTAPPAPQQRSAAHQPAIQQPAQTASTAATSQPGAARAAVEPAVTAPRAGAVTERGMSPAATEPTTGRPTTGRAATGQVAAGSVGADAEWAAAMRAAISADEPARAPAFEMPRDAATAVNPSGTALQSQAGEPDDEEYESAPAKRSWARRITAAVAVMLIVGGLGWLGWQNRAWISGASAIGGLITAKMSNVPSAEAFRASPYEVAGENRDQIDASLQKLAIWRVLKRDFPEWYAERLGDIEKMRAQKADEKVMSKFLADVIVTLRRRNAVASLQSSPDHLKRMASAFVANLKQLASRDGQTCHGFITFGEAHPFIIELTRTPAFAEPLHRQLVAVFEAIAHGRKNQLVHPATRRADYDTLTQELTTRGWTTQDLTTFSDPQRLSRSPPDKVCNLVQEWFIAQVGLKEPELQTRLLAESLKPLAGG